jgi:hypothetical protein
MRTLALQRGANACAIVVLVAAGFVVAKDDLRRAFESFLTSLPFLGALTDDGGEAPIALLVMDLPDAGSINTGTAATGGDRVAAEIAIPGGWSTVEGDLPAPLASADLAAVSTTGDPFSAVLGFWTAPSGEAPGTGAVETGIDIEADAGLAAVGIGVSGDDGLSVNATLQTGGALDGVLDASASASIGDDGVAVGLQAGSSLLGGEDSLLGDGVAADVAAADDGVAAGASVGDALDAGVGVGDDGVDVDLGSEPLEEVVEPVEDIVDDVTEAVDPVVGGLLGGLFGN